MYTHSYICIYMFLYENIQHVCVHPHACIDLPLQIYVYVYIYIYAYVCMYVSLHACMHHSRTGLLFQTYVCLCMYACIYLSTHVFQNSNSLCEFMCLRIYVYEHMYTYTLILPTCLYIYTGFPSQKSNHIYAARGRFERRR